LDNNFSVHRTNFFWNCVTNHDYKKDKIVVKSRLQGEQNFSIYGTTTTTRGIKLLRQQNKSWLQWEQKVSGSWNKSRLLRGPNLAPCGTKSLQKREQMFCIRETNDDYKAYKILAPSEQIMTTRGTKELRSCNKSRLQWEQKFCVME
jgi:hypothetical protein